jgi:hypothetical protein
MSLFLCPYLSTWKEQIPRRITKQEPDTKNGEKSIVMEEPLSIIFILSIAFSIYTMYLNLH